MIPDADQVLMLAELMEQTVHKHGWDQPVNFGIVQSVGVGLAAASVRLPLAAIHPSPEQALLYLAQTMLHGAHPFSLPPRDAGDVAGVYYVGECWAAPAGFDPDADDRRIADVPGAAEVRLVLVLDTAGRAYEVTRRRGEEPSCVTGYIAPPFDVALRDLLLAMTRNAPPGSVDLEAVRAVGREDEP